MFCYKKNYSTITVSTKYLGMHYFVWYSCIGSTPSTETPYNGQVWLDDSDSSTRTPDPLLLYLNTEGNLEPGHVCLPKQDFSNKTNRAKLIADTVCRQLGYTNSHDFEIHDG